MQLDLATATGVCIFTSKLKIKVMTTNEYIIKATLIAYKQGSISLDDALELISNELDLATVK